MLKRSIQVVLLLTTLLVMPATAELLPDQGQNNLTVEETWTISGWVLEKGTRRPLPNATVFIVEQDSIYATSSLDGRYELRLTKPGSYTIAAVAIGFEKSRPTSLTLNESVPKSDPTTIYLLPSTSLPAVTVQDNRNEDRVGKTVVSGKDLEQVAGAGGDPLKAVQALPGVACANDGSAAPAMRGSRPGDNLYYMDGIPLSYLFHLGGFVSIFPANLVNDFNIYASSFGPEYNDATGAVFDVALRNPRSDRVGGNLNVSLVSADILVEGPIDQTQSLFFSARRSYWDLLIGEQTSDEGVTFQFPNYYDYISKYVWNISDDNRLKIYLNGAGDQLEFNIPASSEPAEKEPVLVGESDIDVSFDNQSIIWEARLAQGVDNKFITGHRTTKQHSKIGVAFNLRTENNIYYISDTIKFRPIDNHKFSLGSEYNRSRLNIDVDGVNPLCTEFNPDQCHLSTAQRAVLRDSFSVNGWDIFLKDRWLLMPDVVLIAGVRYSTEDYLNNSFTEPRMGLEWEYSNGGLITLGWGKYHQFPGGRYVLDNFGNRDLDSIQARHSLLGISQLINKNWSVKSEFYYKTFTDFIVADTTPGGTFVNGASGKSYGWELFLKRENEAKLNGWLSLTLSRSERTIDATGESFPFDYDQPVIATWVANYKVSNKWHFGLKWRYHSGARYTPITGSVLQGSLYIPQYGPVNSERLPAYHRLDLRMDTDYVFNTWKLNTYFEIINVYNRCNVAGYDYDAQYQTREETCQLPFFPYFGLQSEF